MEGCKGRISPRSCPPASTAIRLPSRCGRGSRLDPPSQGIEREIAPEWSFGLTWIHREAHDLLQDQDINHVTCPGFAGLGIDPMVICGDAGFLETDRFGQRRPLEISPFGGEVGGNFAFNPAPVFNLPNGAADLYTVNGSFNQILKIGNYNSSEYESYEVKLVKRLYRNWQMQMSYAWSRAFGEAARYSDQSGNDPETIDDEEGFLDYDQRHVVKFQAVTRLPHEIAVGTSIQWSSGVPWSLRRSVIDLDSTGNTNFRSFFPTGQRNDQRNEGFWKIDGRVEKNFTFGRVQASGWVSVENILDEDYLTLQEIDITSADGIPLQAFRNPGRRFEAGATVRF